MQSTLRTESRTSGVSVGSWGMALSIEHEVRLEAALALRKLMLHEHAGRSFCRKSRGDFRAPTPIMTYAARSIQQFSCWKHSVDRSSTPLGVAVCRRSAAPRSGLALRAFRWFSGLNDVSGFSVQLRGCMDACVRALVERRPNRMPWTVNMTTEPKPWMVSLHGGHSWPLCDHAEDSLEALLRAAVEAGYDTFGVTEHAPRLGEHYLYPEERKMGWDVGTLEEKFVEYFQTLDSLIPKFSSDLRILRGFEAEVVPPGEYVDVMNGYREKHGVDYIVGSVHHVHRELIDGPMELFDAALEAAGGPEKLAIDYYEALAEMIAELQPEVVGHFDLIKKNGRKFGDVETPSVQSAARVAMEEVRIRGCVLDLNLAGYRKGFGHPYPSPWAMRMATELEIPFCFGDDSHRTSEVGSNFDEGAAYLRSFGVDRITIPAMGENAEEHRMLPQGRA